LSEDINEIKEKLGLETYYLTNEQLDENSMRSFIQNKVFEKMKNLDKKQKDKIGLLLRWKYAKWIAYCRRKFDIEYPRTKRCSECKRVIWRCYEECPDCKVKLAEDWVNKS